MSEWRDAWIGWCTPEGQVVEESIPQHPMYAMARDALADDGLYCVQLRARACLKKQTDKGFVYARDVIDFPLPVGARTTVMGLLR